MRTTLSPNRIEDYRKFLRIKSLPQYSFTGRDAWFPDEYSRVVSDFKLPLRDARTNWEPSPFLFDYQRDISMLAIRKRKFAVFADCGLGKTLIMLEFANAARNALAACKRVLIVSPLMVVAQTIRENERFYKSTGFPLEQVPASKLSEWLTSEGGGIGITNYDGRRDDTPQGNLGALILDESSMRKSMYGKWGQVCLRLGGGLDWKLCLTGTPAPNDRIEYANHAVFLDHFPTQNAFLAKFFVNRGQTDNRWELKPHALEPFYRALSHWCIFLTNPATYGWKDNVGTIPPINVHIEHVELTAEQSAAIRETTGMLIAVSSGGIVQRGKLARIAKGTHDGEDIPTNKFNAIRDIVNREPNRGTIIWCRYNREQEQMAEVFPNAANISGETKHEKRMEQLDDFLNGRRNQLVSKARILGFGLNLQCATRHIFSSLHDSYEEYYQAIKRSNRIHSVDPLDVYLPITEPERPMIETVLRKAKMVEQDTIEQERIFKKYGYDFA